MNDAVDAATLATLQDLLGAALEEVLVTFLNDAPNRVAAMEAALEGGDLGALERPTHTLKGAAANIGATTLTALCHELVQDCRAGSAPRAPAQVAAIKAELERVRAALAPWCEGEGNGAP